MPRCSCFLIPSSIYKRHLNTRELPPTCGKVPWFHSVKMSACKFYAQRSSRCSKGKDCAFVHSSTHSLESAEVGIPPITQTQRVRACNLKTKFCFIAYAYFTLATRAYGTYPVCLYLQVSLSVPRWRTGRRRHRLKVGDSVD